MNEWMRVIDFSEHPGGICGFQMVELSARCGARCTCQGRTRACSASHWAGLNRGQFCATGPCRPGKRVGSTNGVADLERIGRITHSTNHSSDGSMPSILSITRNKPNENRFDGGRQRGRGFLRTSTPGGGTYYDLAQVSPQIAVAQNWCAR